jgi:hypothetical protein
MDGLTATRTHPRSQEKRRDQSALLGVAWGRTLDASDSTIVARVGIGPTGHGGFGLTVALDLHAPHLARAEAADLMLRAHELLLCRQPNRQHSRLSTGAESLPDRCRAGPLLIPTQ